MKWRSVTGKDEEQTYIESHYSYITASQDQGDPRNLGALEEKELQPGPLLPKVNGGIT